MIAYARASDSGPERYPIRLSQQIINQDVKRLSEPELVKLWNMLKRINPRRCKKLHPPQLGLYTYTIRYGLRAIFRIEPDGTILILHVDHRNDSRVYRFVDRYKRTSHDLSTPIEEIETMTVTNVHRSHPASDRERIPEPAPGSAAASTTDVEKDDVEFIALSLGSLIGRKLTTVERKVKDDLASCVSLLDEVKEEEVERYEAFTARCDALEQKQAADTAGLVSTVDGLRVELTNHLRDAQNNRRMNELRLERNEACIQGVVEDMGTVKTVVSENKAAIAEAFGQIEVARTEAEETNRRLEETKSALEAQITALTEKLVAERRADRESLLAEASVPVTALKEAVGECEVRFASGLHDLRRHIDARMEEIPVRNVTQQTDRLKEQFEEYVALHQTLDTSVRIVKTGVDKHQEALDEVVSMLARVRRGFKQVDDQIARESQTKAELARELAEMRKDLNDLRAAVFRPSWIDQARALFNRLVLRSV